MDEGNECVRETRICPQLFIVMSVVSLFLCLHDFIVTMFDGTNVGAFASRFFSMDIRLCVLQQRQVDAVL